MSAPDPMTLLSFVPMKDALYAFAVFGLASVALPWMPVPKKAATFYASFYSAINFLAHNYGNAANALQIGAPALNLVNDVTTIEKEIVPAVETPVPAPTIPASDTPAVKA